MAVRDTFHGRAGPQLMGTLLACGAQLLLAAQLAMAQSPSASSQAASSAMGGASTATLSAAPAGTPASSRQQALRALGYIEEELVLRGHAATYSKASDWNADGRWTPALRNEAEAYETRILVRRPQDPARFNGTVLVEWFNTSLGIDLDGVWIATREELLREGYAWVGVSAEPASIDALKDA